MKIKKELFILLSILMLHSCSLLGKKIIWTSTEEYLRDGSTWKNSENSIYRTLNFSDNFTKLTVNISSSGWIYGSPYNSSNTYDYDMYIEGNIIYTKSFSDDEPNSETEFQPMYKIMERVDNTEMRLVYAETRGNGDFIQFSTIKHSYYRVDD